MTEEHFMTYVDLGNLLTKWNNPDVLVIQVVDFNNLVQCFQPGSVEEDAEGKFLQYKTTIIRPKKMPIASKLDLSMRPINYYL